MATSGLSISQGLPKDLATAHSLIEEQKNEIKKLKESQIALSDANVRIAELFMDLEDAQDQILEQSNEIQQQNEELSSNLEQLKMMNEQLEELTEMNANLENEKEQSEIVRKSHQKVLSSINYAKRIQESTLPTYKALKDCYDKSFVINNPKDIVGGDFYWCKKGSDIKIIVAADCTGHGVPGAFMTLIGYTLLNKIILDLSVTDPAHILSFLDKELRSCLKQDELSDIRDSIELTVMVDFVNHNKIEVASARRAFFRVRDAVVEIHKGDRSSVGDCTYSKDKVFTKKTFDRKAGDRFYMFSDGIVDQFGGPNDKKFSQKRLLHLVTELQKRSLKTHQFSIEKVLNQWKGKTAQTDDILMLGVEV